MVKIEDSIHTNQPKNTKWSLVFESFNTPSFKYLLIINGVEKVNSTTFQENHFAKENYFGRGIIVNFDDASKTCSIKRSKMESELIYFFSAEDRMVVSNDLVKLRVLTNANVLNRQWMLKFFSFTDDFTEESPIKGVSILPVLSEIKITSVGSEIKNELIPADSSASQNLKTKPKEDWIEAWNSTTKEAISNSCNHSDSVAIMLSSGVDSGGIAAHLVKQQRTNKRPQKLKGFSWHFPKHKQANESKYIQELVDHLGLEHEFIDIDDANCFSDISTWPVALDSPHFNAMRRIKQTLYQTVAAQNFDVLLNGHIGDELCFVDRYVLAELWRDDKLMWLKELLVTIRQTGWAVRHDNSFRYWLKKVLNRDEKELAAPLVLTDVAKANYQKHHLGKTAFVNIRPEQIGLLMANSELAAIATEQHFTSEHNIDRLHPYLNPELIELALACPAYLLSSHQQTKWISRQALSGLLPENMLNRSRVGRLDGLFEHGFKKHIEEIKAYLFRSERRWPEFIREEVVHAVLDQNDWQQAPSIIVPCLGFERWLDEWQTVGLPVQ